jgi:hypothetical protein
MGQCSPWLRQGMTRAATNEFNHFPSASASRQWKKGAVLRLFIKLRMET